MELSKAVSLAKHIEEKDYLERTKQQYKDLIYHLDNFNTNGCEYNFQDGNKYFLSGRFFFADRMITVVKEALELLERELVETNKQIDNA
jgi:hypothetical protein